jgi:hypothetical protein
MMLEQEDHGVQLFRWLGLGARDVLAGRRSLVSTRWLELAQPKLRSPPTPSLARGQSNREKERLNRLNLDATTGAYRRDAT